MSDPKKKAKTTYEAKRISKRVSFNTETEKDLLEKVEKIQDFSKWVKSKIKEI
ncbi:hypothetical protein ACM720_03895 [Neisseria sp. LNP16475]